jgi:Uma2 family endonuclease
MPQTAEQFYLAFAQGREPDSDEPEMKSSLHFDQLALLASTLEWHWRERDDFFIGADLTVYFRPSVSGLWVWTPKKPDAIVAITLAWGFRD